MPHKFYSYKLMMEVPLLTDEEYKPIFDLIYGPIGQLKFYKKEQKDAFCKDLFNEETQQRELLALDLYEDLTGVRLSDPQMIYSVCMSQYGSPCPQCNRPFRTPQAKLCAECGYELPDGDVAGGLVP